MSSYHDEKRFKRLSAAKIRLNELGEMDEETVIRELGFCPAFLRILSVQSGNPLRRFLNVCGSKSMCNFKIFGKEFWI